jgi:hypothetical protein
MQSYRLTDEFADIEAEQALLASLMQSPGLYWDLLDLLTPGSLLPRDSNLAGSRPRVGDRPVS